MKKPMGLGQLGMLIPPLPIPKGSAAKTGLAVANQFAHHPPSIPRDIPRMMRPRGGKGPRNPMD